MKQRAKRIAIDTLGWVCILIGILGVFLPFLQGILLIILGVYLLSLHAVWASRVFEKFKIKYPKWGGKFAKVDERLRAFLGIEKTTP